MIVYHGTTEMIRKPDICHSKKYLDFGRGFYVTSFQKQAEKWALRKGIRQQKEAVVNIYELSDDLSDFRVLHFFHEDERWLDFVCSCRRGEYNYHNYDIIIGAVADDDVFKVVDFYFRGIWNKEKTLRELKYYKSNDQINIVNQEVLEEVLVYKTYYRVSENGK